MIRISVDPQAHLEIYVAIEHHKKIQEKYIEHHKVRRMTTKSRRNWKITGKLKRKKK